MSMIIIVCNVKKSIHITGWRKLENRVKIEDLSDRLSVEL